MKVTDATKMTTFKAAVRTRKGSQPDPEIVALVQKVKDGTPQVIQDAQEKVLKSYYSKLYNIGLRMGVRLSYSSGMVGQDFARRVELADDQTNIILPANVKPILTNVKSEAKAS